VKDRYEDLLQRVLRVVGWLAAAVAAAAGSGAVVLLLDGLNHGRLVPISAGLGCAVAVIVAVQLGYGRLGTGDRANPWIVVRGLVALVELGLGAWIVAYSPNGRVDVLWLVGGVAWALLALTCLSTAHYLEWDEFWLVIGPAVLSEMCFGWLVVRFVQDGPVWAAWPVGTVVVLVLGALLWIRDYEVPDRLIVRLALTMLPAIGVGAVTAKLSLEGHLAAVALVMPAAGLLGFLGAALLGAGRLAVRDYRLSPLTEHRVGTGFRTQHDLSFPEVSLELHEAQGEMRRLRDEVRRLTARLDPVSGDVRHSYLSRDTYTNVSLGQRELDQMAETVARRLQDPISERIEVRMTQRLRDIGQELQRQVSGEARRALRDSVEEAVLGPALANFTGYLSIQPITDGAFIDAVGGTINARAGGLLNFTLTVARDDRAASLGSAQEHDAGPDRPFFAFEPVIIEGGRDATTVEFDAVTDCSSLIPRPHRRSLSVTREQQTTFGFRLPERVGQHEVWFQLYQGGRLLQVVAITIEVLVDPAAVAT
jgi:hypothetical protein